MKANILQHSTSSKFGRFVKKQWVWWLMLLPGVVLTVVFKYGSMFGIVMAFQKFNPSKGLFGSPWVGLKNFQYLFMMSDSTRVIANTLLIATSKVVLNLIIPLIFALMLNEVRSLR